MDYQYLNGIALIEIGIAGTGGSITPTGFVPLEEIEDNSVSIGVNSPAKTRIRVEDKPGTRLTLLGDVDPDVLNFGTINLKQSNMKAVFGGKIDTATSKYYMPGEQVILRIAVRMTTKLVNGLQDIFTFPFIDATATFNGNFTRNAVVSTRVAGDIIPFKDTDGKYYKFIVQTVDATGTPVGDPTVYDTSILFTPSATPAAASGVTAVAPAISATKKFEFIAITGTAGPTQTMLLKKVAALQLTVTYPSEYNGRPFKFTNTDLSVTEGIFTGDNVQVA